jgi:hypothetical protein
MKIEFADSFWKSLDKLSRYDRWYNVAWRTVRYNIPMFFKNIWYFRKELYDFEAWDYRFNLNLFQRSLEATADYIEYKGIEIDKSRLKKVAKIRRVIELLEQDKEGIWIEKAEAELGKLHIDWDWSDKPDTPEQTEHNRKVFQRSDELEAEAWDELWETIKGKKYTTEEEFDGSGIRGWWD